MSALRNYYRADASEPKCGLTPESEKTIEGIGELSERLFVGAESRRLKAIDLMKDIADERAAEPEKRKAEIERVRSGTGEALG